nr:MAG: RNA dependent RNA polymerase [Leviviridae sp.]
MKPPTKTKGVQQAHNPRFLGLVNAALSDLEYPEISNILGLIRSGHYKRALDKVVSHSKQCMSDALATWDDASRLHFARGAQLEAFFKKIPIKCQEIDTKGTALKKFWAAEHRCRRVNARFDILLTGDSGHGRSNGKPFPYSRVLEELRRDIYSLIGPSPDLQSIYSRCRFGPGTSVGLSGNATHLLRKVDASTVGPAAVPYVLGAVYANYQLAHTLLPQKGGIACWDRGALRDEFLRRSRLVHYNKITFVPKTSLTDRTIAIEPAWNTFIQLGVDAELKQKLLKWGVDLTDQSRNQLLAQLGSEEDAIDPFSTLDLSAASDSLATSVVKHLLPADWFNFLNAIRSPSFLLDGIEHRYEKFTSMGNGFCFPLETLIFTAVARLTARHCGVKGYAVYGDDIICRQSAALYTIEILKFLGFSINRDKSYIFGPFRESCGADFFGGRNIRPYTLNFVPLSERDFVKIGNGVSQRSVAFSKVSEFCFDVVSRVGTLTPYSSDADDAALRVPLDVFMTTKWARWDRQLQCWKRRLYRDKAILDSGRVPSGESEEMLCLLSGATEENGSPRFALRRSTRTYIRYV